MKKPIVVKHAQSGDEANLCSCCCLRHGFFAPKYDNLYDFQLILVSVQRTAQISEYSSRYWMGPNPAVAAIFKSRLLKTATEGKVHILCK